MDALAYAQDLIALESTSRLSNLTVIDYLQDKLSRCGFDLERLEYDDERGVRKACLVGKKGEGQDGFAYFGHVDTVPADRWFSDQHGPFTPTVVEDRLYGRGACDMKGSVACALAASETVPADQWRKPFYLVLTADEEVGYTGARHVVANSSLYREMVASNCRGVVGEPTSLEVVNAHKGTYGFRATSRGRAAHSSSTEGLNANLAMIPFLVEMKAIHDETQSDPAWCDDRFDPPTISWNIGVNDFTTAVNITAPQSVCTVYFRPMPEQDGETLLRRARAAAEHCGIEFDELNRGEALFVDPASPYVQETLRLANQTTPRTVCYGTDGSLLTELSRLIVIGPGDIAQAHTEDEWIALEQLEKGVELYGKFLRQWCC